MLVSFANICYTISENRKRDKMKNLWLTKVQTLSFSEWDKCLCFFLDNDEVYDFNEILLCYVAQNDSKKEKIKTYHDISCNCYDCRDKISLKAKD